MNRMNAKTRMEAARESRSAAGAGTVAARRIARAIGALRGTARRAAGGAEDRPGRAPAAALGRGAGDRRLRAQAGTESGGRRQRDGWREGGPRRHLAAVLVCCAAVAVPATANAWVCGGSRISTATHYRVFSEQFHVGQSTVTTTQYGYTANGLGSIPDADYFADSYYPDPQSGPFHVVYFPRPPRVYDRTLSRRYRILEMLNDSGEVKVRLNHVLTPDDRRALSIRFCGETLAFSEATEDTLNKSYTWSNTGQDWSRLTRPNDRNVGDDYHGVVSVSIGVDKTLVAPNLVSAFVNFNAVTLTFDRPLDSTSVPAASAFTIELGTHPGGGDRAYPDESPPTVSAVAIAGTFVQLTLSSAPPQFGGFRPSLVLDYAVPSSNPLQGENDTKVRAFSGQRAGNVTRDVRPSSSATQSAMTISDAGPDELWTNGETLEVAVGFSAPVKISLPEGGTLEANGPVFTFRPHGSKINFYTGNYCADNRAAYNRGDGTATLVFRCTVVNGPHKAIGLAPSSIRRRDSNIWSFGTTRGVAWYKNVITTHGAWSRRGHSAREAVPPEIVGAPSLSEAGPDGVWSPGETVEATLSFSEAVVVDTTDGTPTVELLLGGTAAKAASYLRGSGSETLVFGYTLTDDDGSHGSMLLSLDSLALNGGTIRSRSSGFDALLAHDGAAVLAPPVAARSADGTVGADATVETAEDTAYTFRPSDFGFSDDAKRDRSSHVTIATLPRAGTLSVDGSAASQHQIVDKIAIGSGALAFAPAANAHGDAYASFEFRAYDGHTESAAATMTIDVTPENDDPVGAPALAGEVEGEAEVGQTVTASTAALSDADGLATPGWTYRWIRVADGAETTIDGETASTYVLAADDVGHRIRVEVSYTDDDGTAETAKSAAWPSEGSITAAPQSLEASTETTVTGPTATFSGVPESHDGEAFAFEVHFSEALPHAWRSMLDHTLTVTNGRVTAAQRIDNPHYDANGVRPNRSWRLTVAPAAGAGDVTIVLPAAADCAAPGAVCTTDGRTLASAVSATVPRSTAQTTVQTTPLTASFSQVPAAHDGSSAFSFEVHFSEALPLQWRSMLEHTLTVTNGRVTAAQRIDNPHHDANGARPNRSWRITIEPDGTAAVSVALPAATDCAASGAVCTEDGRMLSGAVSATVQGPVTLSVADARVSEAQGATLGFTVTLSRAASGAVTVDYATADGSATAGEDYTATAGTLAFAAGETSRTVEVPVLDDAVDEGAETLTLTLSNPSPSSVKLADAGATGTIENTDAMPRAWVARFGRTVAEQVLGAVEGRMRAARAPGVEVSLAGRRIGWRPDAGGGRGDATGDEGTDAGRTLAPDVNPAPALAQGQVSSGDFGEARDSHAAADLADWLRDERDGGHAWSRAVTGRELLFGSSFALAGEAGGAGGGTVAMWGRGAVSRFDGRDGELSVDGEVASAMLGADWSRGGAMAGLIAGHSRGEGGYRGGSGDGGVVSSTLTGLYPWGRYALSQRTEVWGAAGYGEGTLTLTPEGGAAMRTDLDLSMAAAGLRGVLVDGGGDGLTVAAKTDAMTVRTATDAAPGLAASEGGVTRVRLGLEGALPLRLAEGSVLTPSLEVGVRRDGGDAESGYGADIGGGVAWRDAGRGLAAELRGRGLLSHESEGFRDRGVSGSLHWEPAEGGRGPRVTLTHTVGGASSGGAEALLGRGTLAGLGASGDGAGSGDLESRRLEARFGYGYGVLGDRFTATPELGVALSDTGREYRLGWGLGLVREGSVSMKFDLSGTRREAAVDDGAGPEHALMLRGQIRW